VEKNYKGDLAVNVLDDFGRTTTVSRWGSLRIGVAVLVLALFTRRVWGWVAVPLGWGRWW